MVHCIEDSFNHILYYLIHFLALMYLFLSIYMIPLFVIVTRIDKDIFDSEYTDDIDIPYLFRHIYVHACLKKKQEIAAWLKELYETMDPIIKIALRQIFAYGDYLIKK